MVGLVQKKKSYFVGERSNIVHLVFLLFNNDLDSKYLKLVILVEISPKKRNHILLEKEILYIWFFYFLIMIWIQNI